MRMHMNELRNCWRATYKNGVMQMTSAHGRRTVHSFVPPNSIVLDVMERRQQVVQVRTKHAPWYEPFLLEDSFYLMDLTEHPRIATVKVASDHVDLAITTGLTLWGKAANHWIQRGYCWNAFDQRKDPICTQDYYESWWRTRQDGIPHHVFTSLARTDHHYLLPLKRDMALFKLRATDQALKYMP